MMITMNPTHALLLLAAVVCSANAFSKYGRTCKDIGCLSSQTCVIASDSCGWSETEGKECGTYPTCKKSSDVNNSPGDSNGPPEPTTRRPFVPPPSNSGDNAPSQPSQPSGGFGGNIYPNIPSAPSAPSEPNNGNRYPGFDPYAGNRNPNPNVNPNPYNPYNGNRDRDPYANRDRDNNGGRDPYSDRNKGSSGSSTFGDIFNFLRGGSGGSGTRYGTGGSGSNSPGYGDIINALSGGGGNRGGGSGGFSDILNSFGNRGSSGSGGFGGSNNGGSSLSDIFFGGRGGTTTRGGFGGSDDRRQQPYQPSPAGGSASGSKDSGFLSGLSSLFGQQLSDSLVRNALSGNRGGSNGGSGNSDIFNSLRYGGLFNEKTGHDANAANDGNKPRVTVSGAGPGGYPTQAPAYPTQSQYRPPQNAPNGYTPPNPNQRQNIQNYNQNNASPQQSSQSSQNAKPYGWSVGRN